MTSQENNTEEEGKRSHLSTEDLRNISHGLSHYDETHGNLPLFKLPRYTCDDETGWIAEVGYRDVRGIFDELIASRERTSDTWRVFDKDDESTWPSEKCESVWLMHDRDVRVHGSVRHAYVFITPKDGCDFILHDGTAWSEEVTHWMPNPRPEPPSSIKTEEKS